MMYGDYNADLRVVGDLKIVANSDKWTSGSRDYDNDLRVRS